jgi:hypothetical protein
MYSHWVHPHPTMIMRISPSNPITAVGPTTSNLTLLCLDIIVKELNLELAWTARFARFT